MSFKHSFLLGAFLLFANGAFAAQVEDEDYVRLEYIEAKGATLASATYEVFRVDTLIPAKKNVAIEAEMACLSAPQVDLNYMGAVYPGNDGWIVIGSYAASDGLLHAYFAIDSRTNAGASIAYDTQFHYYYVGNGRQVIDDKVASTMVSKEMGTKPPTGNNRNDLTITIFSPATGWPAQPVAQNKVRYFNVYTNDIPARKLIPVRQLKGEQKICFYDEVTDAYFYAQGPGELTAGPTIEQTRAVSVMPEWYFEGSVSGPAAGEYEYGTELNYVAEAKSGYAFAGWSGDIEQATVDGNRLTIVVSKGLPVKGLEIKAKFAKVKRPHVFSMSVKATSFAEGGDLVTQERRSSLVTWLKTYGFSKVYLESYRHNVYAPTETLTAARDEFADAGFEVCGLITPTCLDLDPSATPEQNKYATCFSNPQARLRLSNEVARCAALFDTILLDDFLYANCPASCPHCGNATAAFRLDLINAVSREIVAAARTANPNCRCIIKYPTWHANWAERGLVPSEQTAIFGECWAGSETRDAGADPFWACVAYDYLNTACGGRCGGVWFDPLDSQPAKFVEQAYYSILGGAPESLFHCYDYMLGDNGGSTPFGEDYSRAKDCTTLLLTKMNELHQLADFCDAAERVSAAMSESGVSRHAYVKEGEIYLARLNTRATAVEDEFGNLAANEFVFPTKDFPHTDIPGAKYLPGGYLVLHYIYSTPSAANPSWTSSPTDYIDTGYTPTSADFGFYFDFAYNGAVGADAPRIMGTSLKLSNGYFAGIALGAYAEKTHGEFWAFYNASDFVPGGVVVDPWILPKQRQVLELKNRLFTAADGTVFDLTKYSNVDFMNGNVWIGNVNTPDAMTKTGAAPLRVYRFKIYEGDTVVHDFVPVQAPNGFCGLYDVVGDKGFRLGRGYLAGPWRPDETTIRRVQYIESTGTQYFDLGVIARKGVAIEAEMACCGDVQKTGDKMGAVYAGSKGWIVVGNYGGDGGDEFLGSYFAQGTRAGATISRDAKFHHYYSSNGNQSVDDVSATSTVANEMPKTLNLNAFAYAVDYDTLINSIGKYPACVMAKSIKVYSDGKLVRNLIPVVAGGKACMYDKVSKVLFLNEGTGEFIAGPSIGMLIFVR